MIAKNALGLFGSETERGTGGKGQKEPFIVEPAHAGQAHSRNRPLLGAEKNGLIQFEGPGDTSKEGATRIYQVASC